MGFSTFAAYAAIASAAVSATAAVRQGNLQKNVAAANAEEDRKRAAVERNVATTREETARERARQVIGQQLAAGSMTGAQLSGSSLDLYRQSMFDAEMDALNIRYDSELNATALERQATTTSWAGRQAANGSYFSAAGSLLNGAGSYYGASRSVAGSSGVSDFRLGEIRSYG